MSSKSYYYSSSFGGSSLSQQPAYPINNSLGLSHSSNSLSNYDITPAKSFPTSDSGFSSSSQQYFSQQSSQQQTGGLFAGFQGLKSIGTSQQQHQQNSQLTLQKIEEMSSRFDDVFQKIFEALLGFRGDLKDFPDRLLQSLKTFFEYSNRDLTERVASRALENSNIKSSCDQFLDDVKKIRADFETDRLHYSASLETLRQDVSASRDSLVQQQQQLVREIVEQLAKTKRDETETDHFEKIVAKHFQSLEESFEKQLHASTEKSNFIAKEFSDSLKGLLLKPQKIYADQWSQTDSGFFSDQFAQTESCNAKIDVSTQICSSSLQQRKTFMPPEIDDGELSEIERMSEQLGLNDNVQPCKLPRTSSTLSQSEKMCTTRSGGRYSFAAELSQQAAKPPAKANRKRSSAPAKTASLAHSKNVQNLVKSEPISVEAQKISGFPPFSSPIMQKLVDALALDEASRPVSENLSLIEPITIDSDIFDFFDEANGEKAAVAKTTTRKYPIRSNKLPKSQSAFDLGSSETILQKRQISSNEAATSLSASKAQDFAKGKSLAGTNSRKRLSMPALNQDNAPLKPKTSPGNKPPAKRLGRPPGNAAKAPVEQVKVPKKKVQKPRRTVRKREESFSTEYGSQDELNILSNQKDVENDGEQASKFAGFLGLMDSDSNE